MNIKTFDELFQAALLQEKENFSANSNPDDWLENMQWLVHHRASKIIGDHEKFKEYVKTIFDFSKAVNTGAGRQKRHRPDVFPRLTTEQFARFLELREPAARALAVMQLLVEHERNIPPELLDDARVRKAWKKMINHEQVQSLIMTVDQIAVITNMDPWIIKLHHAAN